MSPFEVHECISQLLSVPALIEEVVSDLDLISNASYLFQNTSSALFLGRSTLYPIALEGALKLKEISYIHAEGYAGGEMKHGPIALVDQELPVIAVIQNDQALSKILANIQEVKARAAKVIVVRSEDVEISEEYADYVITVPSAGLIWQPLLHTIPR